jgi:hypothetical protein
MSVYNILVSEEIFLRNVNKLKKEKENCVSWVEMCYT